MEAVAVEAVARSRVSNDTGIKINCPRRTPGRSGDQKSQRPDWAWSSSWQSESDPEKGDGQISVAGSESFEQSPSSSTLQTLCSPCSPFPACTVVLSSHAQHSSPKV